jgi:hypothetical protein
MKQSYQLFAGGAAAFIALAGCAASFCWLGLFRCTVGSGFTWREAVFPRAGVFAVLMLISVLVLACAAAAVAATKHRPRGVRGLGALVSGGLAACVLRLSWEVFTGSFPDTFHLHLEYVPFGVAGAVTAGVLLLLGFKRA